MKRKITTLLMFVLLLLLISSCHGRQIIFPETIIPKEFDTTREYNISFWAKNDTNKIQKEIYEQAINDFETIYPNVHVSIRHFYSYPELYEAILQNIGTGTTPNVAIAYPDHVAAYLENASLISNLDDYIENANYGLDGSKKKYDSPKKSDLILRYLNEGYLAMDGIQMLYTLPFMRSTECLYYNKTWLINHGFTIPKNNIFSWNYIWEICEYAANNDKSVVTPLIYKSSDNFFIQLAKQYGNDFTTEEGDILFVNDGNKQFVKDLNAKFKAGLFATWQNSGVYPGDYMNKGKAIFGIDSSAGSTWIGADAPLAGTNDYSFELGVATIPQIDVNKPVVISQGPSLCLFNRTDDQEELASWLFLQYLLTDKVQLAYAETEGYSPVTQTAINSKDFQDFLKSNSTYIGQRYAIENVIEYLPYTFITPAFNNSAVVRESVGKIINSACLSKTKTPNYDKLFNDALKDCQSS